VKEKDKGCTSIKPNEYYVTTVLLSLSVSHTCTKIKQKERTTTISFLLYFYQLKTTIQNSFIKNPITLFTNLHARFFLKMLAVKVIILFQPNFQQQLLFELASTATTTSIQ